MAGHHMLIPPDLKRALLVTPIGELTLVASSRGLRAVVWPGERGDRSRQRRASSGATAPGQEPADVDPETMLRAAAEQLGEYFAGTRTAFELPLDLLGTPFQLAAWEVLRGIPHGSTISYGEQARRLGDPRKARAAGSANGRNPIPIIVPCHRVIGGDGSLAGFAAGMEAKAWLLHHERSLTAARQSSGSKSASTQERSK
jgi:methylated-DNA-[protein]-cysteine S-methyltransferase